MLKIISKRREREEMVDMRKHLRDKLNKDREAMLADFEKKKRKNVNLLGNSLNINFLRCRLAVQCKSVNRICKVNFYR